STPAAAESSSSAISSVMSRRERVRRRRRQVTAGLAAVVAVSLSLIAVRGRVSSVFNQRMDPARIVVFPFRGDARAGEAVRRSFEDAWGDWQDLHIVPDAEAAEVLPNDGIPRSLSEVRTLAKKLGARRVVWGEVYPAG